MRILLAGGTGLLGTALADSLRRDGHRVTILTRHPHDPRHLAWSPQAGLAPTALNDTDVVVNLAGAPIVAGRWTAARKAEIRASRVGATRVLAEAVRSASRPPAVFVSGSAVGFYGVGGDETLTEESPPGSDFLARICRDWETEALTAAGRTRVVLLRTGVVLSTAGGALPQMARPFRFLVGGPLGSGRQYVSWIHVDDWVGLVRWALATAAVSGALNLTAPNPVTNRDMANAIGRALKRPAMVPAPAFALKLLLGELADAALLGGQRVMPAKALAQGFSFRYPTIAGALRALYGSNSGDR